MSTETTKVFFSLNMTDDERKAFNEADPLGRAAMLTHLSTLPHYPRSLYEIDIRNEAKRQMQAEYWDDVRGVAEEFESMAAAGDEFTDAESASEWLEQTVYGHARVIYTYQAQECLLHSDNDGAYIDDFGTDGVVKDGAINWSALAYAAFLADIRDRIEDLNQPFKCPHCDERFDTHDERQEHAADCDENPNKPAADDDSDDEPVDDIDQINPADDK